MTITSEEKFVEDNIHTHTHTQYTVRILNNKKKRLPALKNLRCVLLLNPYLTMKTDKLNIFMLVSVRAFLSSYIPLGKKVRS